MNKYANFWQRFAAMWIDFFVLLPLAFIQLSLESISKVSAIALVLPMAALVTAYPIFCHGRFGQTVGKRVMDIRVVKLNGERVGWREAWLRSSGEIVLAVFSVIGSFVALSLIADAEYYGVGWVQRGQNLAALEPAWLAWTSKAGQIWVWSEIIVMLFNKRRRALHDFIAGTVVISEQKFSDGYAQAV